jgi:transposase
MPTLAGIREISRARSIRLDGYVPIEHPLRRVRSVVDAPLGSLREQLRTGPSVRCPIGAEQMVRALLLQFLFAIRRDRQLVEQIWYSVLFRWFVGVRVDEPKWDLEVFATYRQEMLSQDLIRGVLLRGLSEAHNEGLLSAEALTARRCELAQFSSEMTVGVGHPGVLPG